MNLHKWTGPIAALTLAGLLSACDEGLTEINKNPNSPETVPVAAVLSSGMWDLVQNNGGRGVFGEWTTLFHLSTWAQHTAQSAYNDEDKYQPREGINENIWTEMYSGALTDLKNAQDLGVAANDQNLVAVTDILLVYGFMFLTDTFGDIPYSEALNLEEFPQPHFDAQENIYPDMIARLATAAGQITPGTSVSWATGDLIYGGDLARWQEFANSLLLRLAMRTSETSYASTAAGQFATAWAANRFDNNADDADLDWSGSLPFQSPFFEQIVLGGRPGDFRVSETVENLLSSTNDPRLEVFLEPAESDGAYRGLPNGYLPGDLGNGIADYSTIGSVFLAASAPSVLQSYAETLFLGAEAASLGWISGSAADLCAQGITASMTNYGISAADIAAYLSANPCSTRTEILTQKYLALFLVGPESYADFRRTGVPALSLSYEAVIPQFPSRMPYPDEEALYNPNFADYATVPYTAKVWWMPTIRQ